MAGRGRGLGPYNPFHNYGHPFYDPIDDEDEEDSEPVPLLLSQHGGVIPEVSDIETDSDSDIESDTDSQIMENIQKTPAFVQIKIVDKGEASDEEEEYQSAESDVDVNVGAFGDVDSGSEPELHDENPNESVDAWTERIYRIMMNKPKPENSSSDPQVEAGSSSASGASAEPISNQDKEAESDADAVPENQGSLEAHAVQVDTSLEEVQVPLLTRIINLFCSIRTLVMSFFYPAADAADGATGDDSDTSVELQEPCAASTSDEDEEEVYDGLGGGDAHPDDSSDSSSFLQDE